jgi:hypothetical protein
LHIELIELRAPLGQSVDVGSLNPAPMKPNVSPTEVVSNHDDDVWRLIGSNGLSQG